MLASDKHVGKFGIMEGLNIMAQWTTQRPLPTNYDLKRSIADFFTHPESTTMELSFDLDGEKHQYKLTMKKNGKFRFCEMKYIHGFLNKTIGHASAACSIWLQLTEYHATKIVR